MKCRSLSSTRERWKSKRVQSVGSDSSLIFVDSGSTQRPAHAYNSLLATFMLTGFFFVCIHLSSKHAPSPLEELLSNSIYAPGTKNQTLSGQVHWDNWPWHLRTKNWEKIWTDFYLVSEGLLQYFGILWKCYPVQFTEEQLSGQPPTIGGRPVL